MRYVVGVMSRIEVPLQHASQSCMHRPHQHQRRHRHRHRDDPRPFPCPRPVMVFIVVIMYDIDRCSLFRLWRGGQL